MLNWVLGELNSKIQLLIIFIVMLAAALFLGATFTQAVDYAHSVVAFVAAVGSVVFAVGIFALVARFSDALNSLLKFLR